MTIDEAIKHCLEVAEENDLAAETYELLAENNHNAYERLTAETNSSRCAECAADHRQLAEWLTELQELRLQIEAPKLGSIEEYHYELAKCKVAFWSCNRRCMNAEEQYRRKADELRKAQEQIAEQLMELKVAKQYLMEAVDGFRALGKELDEKCELNLDCSKCQLNNGGNCRSWKHAKAVMKLIGGKQ